MNKYGRCHSGLEPAIRAQRAKATVLYATAGQGHIDDIAMPPAATPCPHGQTRPVSALHLHTVVW